MRDAAWFRHEIEALFGSGSQSALARFMSAAGDDRSHKTILRAINEVATGRRRVSGEMVVLLRLLSASGIPVEAWKVAIEKKRR